MGKKYLTTSQAAKLCNVTRFTIRNWINSGELKSSKTAGGHRRISKDEMAHFMEKKNMSKEKHVKAAPVKKAQKRESKRERAASDDKGLLNSMLFGFGKCAAVVKKSLRF